MSQQYDSWKKMFQALATLREGERLWIWSDTEIEAYTPNYGSFITRFIGGQKGYTIPAIKKAIKIWKKELYHSSHKNKKELTEININDVIRGIQSLIATSYKSNRTDSSYETEDDQRIIELNKLIQTLRDCLTELEKPQSPLNVAYLGF